MNDYLEHHGIVGQKWNHKNGPPYPLSTSEHEHVTREASSKAKMDAVVRGGDSAQSLHTSNSKKHISDLSAKDVLSNAGYATYKNQDVNKYLGLFGTNLKRRAKASGQGDANVYQVKLKATSKLKIPSDQQAAKTTNQLLKDKEFRSDLQKSLDNSKAIMKRPAQQSLFRQANKVMGKIPPPPTGNDANIVYKALNLSLTNHNDYDLKVQDKFYGALKKKGYSAIVDVNDQKYSSYHAERPMIVFDTSKVVTSSIRQVGDKEILKASVPANADRYIKEVFENGMTVPMREITKRY